MRRLRGKPGADSHTPDTGPSVNNSIASPVSLTSGDGPALSVSNTLSNGPSPDVRLKGDLSPTPDNGPLQTQPLAHHRDGPLRLAGPSPDKALDQSFSILDSLPDVDGFLLWFHQLTDYLACQLTPHEQALYLQLYRLSWGFDNSEDTTARCIIGFPRLAERSSMAESGARLAAKGLIQKGLVRKVAAVFGKNREQGIEWEVFAPPALVKYRASRNKGPAQNDGPARTNGPLRPAPIKEINTHKEHTQTQSGVSVDSRFSLKECRRYADHLKQTGQVITNPGGYATKIFRSGEADAFIEAFLNPPAQIDISQCSDCRGTGFIYIDTSNHDIGVRPCKHDKLRAST